MKWLSLLGSPKKPNPSEYSSVMLYADIRNLFFKLNVKWMDSLGRIGGELGDPSAYYDLRRVKIGFRMEL
ncbi:MAG: hypothetical protein NTZ35_18045 [Ignavibacteriales bacterium]|nr:hypothetical protein [Ignavibacteriales bacterium]